MTEASLPPSKEPIWTLPFILAFAAHFVFSLGFWMFVHLPGFLQELGGKEAQIGTVIAALSISAILVRPWLGHMMDSHGRRPVVLAGALLNFFAVAAYLSVDSLGSWLYIIRIVHGFSEAALFSVMFTLAADVVPRSRRAEGIAIFGISGLLPLSLGGLLGDAILARWDYTTLFAVAAGISLLAFFVCLPIAESKPAQGSEEGPRAKIWDVFVHRALLPLWVITLGFTFGLTSYFTFLKTYVGKVGIGSVGGFFLAYSIASVGLRVFFSWLPGRIGLRKTLIPAIASLTFGVVLLGHAGSALAMGAAGVLCGLGHGFIFPILSALVVDRASVANRGVAMTLFTAIFDVGALLGAPILGWVIETHGYTTMFTVAACVIVACSVLFAVLDVGNA